MPKTGSIFSDYHNLKVSADASSSNLKGHGGADFYAMDAFIQAVAVSRAQELLHQVSLICGRMQTYPGQMYPPVETSGGQEQYYIRSPLHLVVCSFHV